VILQHTDDLSQNISIRDIIADTGAASEWFREKIGGKIDLIFRRIEMNPVIIISCEEIC
jgi:hypothetical protein